MVLQQGVCVGRSLFFGDLDFFQHLAAWRIDGDQTGDLVNEELQFKLGNPIVQRQHSDVRQVADFTNHGQLCVPHFQSNCRSILGRLRPHTTRNILRWFWLGLFRFLTPKRQNKVCPTLPRHRQRKPKFLWQVNFASRLGFVIRRRQSPGCELPLVRVIKNLPIINRLGP